MFSVSFFNDTSFKKLKNAMVLEFSLILIIVLSTTSNSIDRIGYEEMYYSSTSINTDFIFNSFIYVHRYFFNDFDLFYITVGFINSILLCIILFRYNSLERVVFIVMYASFFIILKDFIQVRNALALKFFIFSIFELFKKNNRKYFLLFYFIAIGIHNSLIIFFPVFILYKKIIINKKKLISYLIFLIIIYFYHLSNNFLFNIPSIPITGRISIYLQFQGNFDTLSLFHFAKILSYSVFFYAIYQMIENKTDEVKFYLFSIYFAYFVRVFFLPFSLLTGRLAENLYLGEILFFVNVYTQIKKKKGIIFFMVIYCFLNLYSLISNLFFLDIYENFLY